MDNNLFSSQSRADRHRRAYSKVVKKKVLEGLAWLWGASFFLALLAWYAASSVQWLIGIAAYLVVTLVCWAVITASLKDRKKERGKAPDTQ
jgi:hypothetical protein